MEPYWNSVTTVTSHEVPIGCAQVDGSQPTPSINMLAFKYSTQFLYPPFSPKGQWKYRYTVTVIKILPQLKKLQDTQSSKVDSDYT